MKNACFYVQCAGICTIIFGAGWSPKASPPPPLPSAERLVWSCGTEQRVQPQPQRLGGFVPGVGIASSSRAWPLSGLNDVSRGWSLWAERLPLSLVLAAVLARRSGAARSRRICSPLRVLRVGVLRYCCRGAEGDRVKNTRVKIRSIAMLHLIVHER